MSSPPPCPACGCRAASAAHAVVAALQVDDLDGAFEAGLMHVPACAHCEATCTHRWLAVRAERERALAARDRFRARQVRLEARANARARSRTVEAPADAPPPALPDAAAAALARARARAAQRHKP